MSSGRVLRFLNLSIAILLVLVLAAAYWFAYRPLPQTSGTMTAPISAPATVIRDALGVPHITAAKWEDAIFLQGFVAAQDRMWQLDAMRRLAAGELAEVVGPAAAGSDEESRRLRIPQIAEEQARSLSEGDRAVLAAYARGVNFYLETHRHSLPLEFTLLNYSPRPWRIADSLLVGVQMYRTLTTSWRWDLRKQDMLEAGDAAKVNALFPFRTGIEVQPGSNAWVISGRRTASGRPILANDPHLEFSAPSIWYMVHLQAPGLNVTGVALPGVPCVIIGHNDRIAWGVTNLQYDVEDLYLEKFDPRTGRYEYRGQEEQARAERSVLAVGGERPREFVNWVTRHGPLIASENHRYYSLRWAAADAAPAEFAFLDLDRARNWQEFVAAIARFDGPGQNFVYADVDGNIGYHATGRLPIRRNFAGDVPVDGSSGEFEWDGYIPFDKLPAVYNPPSGVLVTANQNPFPDRYPYPVSGFFDPGYRSRQIYDRLTARNGWKPAEMLAVETDVYSAFSHFLARQVVAACDARQVNNPDLGEAIQVLRAWNGQMEKGTAAPMLAVLVFQQLRKAVAERAAKGKGAEYTYAMAPAVIERLLRTRPKDWFRDFDQMLVKALADAVAEGRRQQGSSVHRWDYGRYNELTVRNPVEGQLPVVGGYFNIGPTPMSGSATTVKQMGRLAGGGVLGPSMRMVVDFSNLDGSLQNIALGESGQVLSSHYKDQWDAYYAGRSYPMQFHHVEAREVLRVKPSR